MRGGVWLSTAREFRWVSHGAGSALCIDVGGECLREHGTAAIGV